mmetsp:Transcript_27232/g.48939  ORF Transcript_27232/g.48939 Transcript_27232/m.48939 type:complete len:210 (+) Transcript_27232:295-924(+)
MDLASDSSELSAEEQKQIKPPFIRVTKVLRNTIDDSQSTIFECSAKQLHKQTRSTILPETLQSKLRRTMHDSPTKYTPKRPSRLYRSKSKLPEVLTSEAKSPLVYYTNKVSSNKSMLGQVIKQRLTNSRSNSVVKHSEVLHQRQRESKNSLIFRNYYLKPLEMDRLKPTPPISFAPKASLSQQSFSFESLPRVGRPVLKNFRYNSIFQT